MIHLKRFSLIMLIAFISIDMFGMDVWVSNKGNDKNSGTSKSPVATLDAALRILKSQYSKTPFTDATIWLEAGRYIQRTPLVIDKSDFQNDNVKITIASKGKEKAIITNGYSIPVNKFKKVSDPAVLSRLNDDAASKILVADLKGTGLDKLFAQNTTTGTGWDYRPINYTFISWDANLLQLAQWPNRGYGHIKELIATGPTTRWLKPGENPASYSHGNPNGGIFTLVEKSDISKWEKEFKQSEDVLMQGYPHNDWYYQQEKVGKFTDKSVELLRYTRYGIETKKMPLPRRVRFINLLCELDEPGEWYFDNQTKQFFVYPIEKINNKTIISVLSGDVLLRVNHLDNFSVKNVIFEDGGKLALEVNNSSNTLIAGCVFRNFSGRAFNINGGNNNGVLSCDFYGLESVGSLNGDYNGDKAAGTGLHIDAMGKSRQTLKPCGSYMVNNDIHDCRLRGYGLVGLNGVGLRFAHNLLHDMNGAVNFSGNDIILEYNEFYNLGWEMGDWNVAYIGADWASFGNEVRYNFVHHMMETPQAYSLEAFRNDDLGMGVSFHGNYFYKTGSGGVVFSGAGNTCEDNIILETKTVYRPAHRTKKYLEDADIKQLWTNMKVYDDGKEVRGDKDDFLWRAERFYGKMGWNFEPYRSKYPIIRKIMNDGDPFAPSFSVIKDNYVGDTLCYKSFKRYAEIYPKTAVIEKPNVISRDAFEDLSVLNLAFKKGFKPVAGFKVTDFSKIGMYSDEYRKAPNKDVYRKAVKDRYEGVRSSGGRYDMKTANLRFPVPSYLKK